VLIHAAKGMTQAEYDDACHFVRRCIDPRIEIPNTVPQGGIIGSVEIVDCVTRSQSRWFCGRYGFMTRNAQPLPFYPYKGQLGFFEVK